MNEALAQALLQIGFEVGGNLLNLLWIPKVYIQSQVDRFVSLNFNGFFVIGLQIRTDFLNIENIRKDLKKFFKCAYMIAKRNKIDKNKVRFFVSSDQEDVLKMLNSQYGDKVLMSKSSLAIKHIGIDPSGYERAIIDVELLSRCNQLVVTGGSTFGFIAAMKRLRMPFYVNVKDTRCWLMNFTTKIGWKPAKNPSNENKEISAF
jgi:hypothetical protein